VEKGENLNGQNAGNMKGKGLKGFLGMEKKDASEGTCPEQEERKERYVRE